MHKCPSCQADVPNVMTKDDLEKRLSAKSEEIKMLRASLSEHADKAGRFDAVESERARLASEVVRLTEGAARAEALAGLGVHDRKVAASFEALYASEVAGAEDPPAFEAWLEAEEGARANPLLIGYFAGAPGDAPGAPVDPGPRAPAPVPPAPAGMPGNTGARPQPQAPSGKLTPGQLRAFLQQKTPDEAAAWMRAHGAQYGLPQQPPKPPSG